MCLGPVGPSAFGQIQQPLSRKIEQPASEEPAAAAATAGASAQPTAQPAQQAAAPQASAAPVTAPPPAPPPAGGALPASSGAPAQQYVELRPPEGRTERYYTQLRAREILGLLSAGTIPPDKEELFREYYEQYAFARWTWPEQFGKLPEFRRELRNELLTARGKPIHGRLRDLALEILARFARDEGGPYHPATRVSAVLAIADLNAAESVNPREQPVVPLPEAAALLVELLKRDDLPDAVVAATLVGLRRHAVLGVENQQLFENELLPRLLTLASTRVPPPGRSLEGHQWIRARAIEILGLLGLPGPNGAVAQLLTNIAGASDEAVVVRRAAVRALGMLDLSGVSKPTVPEILYALGRYVAEVCEMEIKTLDAQIQMGDIPSPTGRSAPGMRPYGGYPGEYMSEYMTETYMMESYAPGMPGSPAFGPGRQPQQTTEDRTVPNRRRLKAQLNAAFFAITGVDEPMWVPANRPMDGVAAVVPESGPAREGLQQLFERLQAVLAICDTKDLERQTLRDRIRAEYEQLQELLTNLETLSQTASTPTSPPQT